jgi:iron-sulfur cluster insertion protein
MIIEESMINLTASAAEQVADICNEENVKYVRAFIQGGGCSGFNYGFSMEDEKNEDDFLIGDRLLVDAMSMQYFDGATIDYVSDRLKGSQFVIKNPNAKTTCGCGSSFSV